MTAQFPAKGTTTTVPVHHDGTFSSYRDKNTAAALSRYSTKAHFPAQGHEGHSLHAETTQSPATGTTTEDKGTVAPRDSAYSNAPGGDYPGDNTKQHRLAVTRPDRLQALQQFRHPLTQSSGGPMASPKRPTPTTPSKTKRRNPQNEETRRREPPGEREERRRVQLWGPETSPSE